MRTIFWNVDTENDFMRSNGKLYVLEAEKIDYNLERLTQIAEKKNIKVINTADRHNKRSEEISEKPDFVNTFPEHCMEDTWGALFIPSTDPRDPYIINWTDKSFDEKELINRRNIILYKDKFDIFKGNPHAEKVVEILAPERAIIYGVATNVCVNFAVIGLLERKTKVYVPIDAIKELPNLPLPFDKWKRKGAILTTTDEILKEIGNEEAYELGIKIFEMGERK